MRTKKEIEQKINEIEADERYKAGCATVFENAPLALIQCALENQVSVLKWVLEK